MQNTTKLMVLLKIQGIYYLKSNLTREQVKNILNGLKQNAQIGKVYYKVMYMSKSVLTLQNKGRTVIIAKAA